ncbi:MAG TPA: M20/M25/M40 family metallo-hydrolase [Pyrinomonadaceae bacterium]|nr:M20/M25/M40 family metallo-hydrolase [Pyrinomonadaceae bacterium]
MKRKLAPLVALVCLLAPLAGGGRGAAGQERVNAEVYWKIRREAAENSRVMRIVHHLTDLYGPRLTGSPNFKAAAEWAVKEMESWGLKNARLEPWDFGHPGWQNERLSAHVVAPVKDHLVCEALAWTPSTNGPARGEVVQLFPPERPTAQQLAAYLAGFAGRVRGRVVLAGPHQKVYTRFNQTPLRRDEQDARNLYDPDNPAPAFTPSPTPTPAPPGTPAAARPLTTQQVNEAVDKFLVEGGALVRVNDAGREHGQIRAFSNRTYDVSKAVPTAVCRNEDYGRVSRLLADGRKVELEFDILNRTYPEGRTAYNVFADIPGNDRKDEIVMLGGHLDSWHAATGATDNAVGCAVMMEAARLLKAAGVRPRRTVRVALWSGEEQGLLGSRAYVREHFGTFENPKPPFFKLSGYFNVDSGTGRIRGATVFGPPEAADVLRQALAPLEDMGVVGATATASRRTGGSDHTSFNAAGLPGIGLGQDPIEYGSHTWHTNLDTYERIVEDDVRRAAVVVAAAVYHLAMRDDPLPRFTKEKMPPPPPAPSPSPTPTPPPDASPTPAASGL